MFIFEDYFTMKRVRFILEAFVWIEHSLKIYITCTFFRAEFYGKLNGASRQFFPIWQKKL